MSIRHRILVADDEELTRELLSSALRYAGFDTAAAGDGREAVDLAQHFHPDLVLLDLMMPGLDGYEVSRRLQGAHPEIPIIFVTARDDTESKLDAFSTGGDDYVTKPFALDELLARIRAVLKRTGTRPAEELHQSYGGIRLDDTAHQVHVDDERIHLSPTEYRLLRYLLVKAESVVTRTQIIDAVWGHGYSGHSGIVETYVFYLRRKLRGSGRLVQTVRGVGYTLRTPDA